MTAVNIILYPRFPLALARIFSISFGECVHLWIRLVYMIGSFDWFSSRLVENLMQFHMLCQSLNLFHPINSSVLTHSSDQQLTDHVTCRLKMYRTDKNLLDFLSSQWTLPDSPRDCTLWLQLNRSLNTNRLGEKVSPRRSTNLEYSLSLGPSESKQLLTGCMLPVQYMQLNNFVCPPLWLLKLTTALLADLNNF